MARVETLQRGSLQDVISTAKIAVGSLSSNFAWENEENRAAFRSVVTDTLRLPANVEEDTIGRVMQIAENRQLSNLSIDYSTTYWDPGQKYRRLHILNGLSQYFNVYDFPLPLTVIPPEGDVKEYINRANSSERPLTIPQQLEAALDITGDNVVGAANVAFMASRQMGRSYDQRAYPGIRVYPQDHVSWNEKVAHFEVYDRSGRVDGIGDTYYFWSHAFAALALRALGGRSSEIFQIVLKHGTPLMRIVRTHIARRSTETPHEEASVLGRNLGLALAEEVGVSERPAYSSNKGWLNTTLPPIQHE